MNVDQLFNRSIFTAHTTKNEARKEVEKKRKKAVSRLTERAPAKIKFLP